MSFEHTEQKGDTVIPKVAGYYKVTFGHDLVPVITALDDNAIWDGDNGGLTRAKPFVVCNPGNRQANKDCLARLARKIADPQFANEKRELEDYRATVIAFVPKFFARSMQKMGVPIEGMQFLVALNETGPILIQNKEDEIVSGDNAKRNMDLIREHNANPDGFTTAYTIEQARLIYGPLITDGKGGPLPAEKIIENLSKARNYNVSYGSVTANCQVNALVKMMRNLKIPDYIIRAGVESMRRVDCANIAKASQNGIFASAVILEGSNDLLSARYIGGKENPAKIPPVPVNHVHTSVVPLGANRIKVYQTSPIEVYNPGKKPSAEEKVQEDAIRHSLPASFEAKVAASREIIKDKILGYLGLDGLRIKDQDLHDPAHLTCEATPGNVVPGRDPDLLYQLMADMMTREDPRDVSRYFKANRFSISCQQR